MPSDFTLNLDVTDEQKEEIMRQYKESDKTHIEAFLQDEYIPRALDALQGGEAE